MKGRSLTAALAVLAMLAFALPAAAQLQRGAIYGTVLDNTSAALPGVTLTLSSTVMAPMTTVSGSRGEFRFGELDPGTYTLTASLQGFAPYTRKDIVVTVGSNVQLPVNMALAGVKQEVTVTAATPVLNAKEHGYQTTFGEAALNEVPTARDPWVLLQQVPGVLVDRVNVGGSESGQQSGYSARGDTGLNTMWNIDGVTITDVAALGSSSTYYNFDVFQEVQYTTGGTDPREQTGALGINMVTKRGTNDFHGLGRIYFDNHKLQGNNVPADLAAAGFVGNHINQIADYGVDIGGPIVKNKLWFWGAAGKNDIRMIAINGTNDNTKLTNQTAKIDFQPIESNHANFFFYRNEKVKIGRNAGITRPQETTWNQGGPTDIYKFEDSHVFGPHLMLTGRYAHVSSGFFLTPQAGLNAQVYQNLDEGSVWHGGYLNFTTERPQDQVNVDSNYFRGVHELKVGFQYRRTPVTSLSQWTGNQTYAVVGPDTLGIPNDAATGLGVGLAEITRAAVPDSRLQYTSFYAGDTISLNRVTIDAALRFDRQRGENLASVAVANQLAPAIMPALNFPGSPAPFTWNNWSPRIGATLRVNDKTNLRASYSLFAAQLGSTYVTYNSPMQLSDIEYTFLDSGNHIVTSPSQLLSPTGSSYGVDPANPAAGFAPNQINPNLKAPKTHSIQVSLDREVAPNFAVSTSFGYGYTYDVLYQHYIGLTPADFVPLANVGDLAFKVNGQTQSVSQLSTVTPNAVLYGVAPGSSLPTGNGTVLDNRPGYHIRYWAWDVTATKRLSNKWMMRGYFTLDNNQEIFKDPSAAIQNPTPLAVSNFTVLNQPYNTQDGGIFLNWGGNTSGTKSDIFIQAKWSYSLMAMYQLPWGITAAGTVYGRQGYPNPLYVRVNYGALQTVNGPIDSPESAGLGSRAQVLVNTNLDQNRNPNVHMVDLRAEKAFTIRGFSAVVNADLFNAFNNNTLLQRNRQVNSALFNQTREIIAPRIVRFGLRLQF